MLLKDLPSTTLSTTTTNVSIFPKYGMRFYCNKQYVQNITLLMLLINTCAVVKDQKTIKQICILNIVCLGLLICVLVSVML